MSESSKSQSLLDENGKVKDKELAEKMARTEKDIRDTFNKTDDKSEVEEWANQASEGVFRQEVGKEYSDGLKEAQEEAGWEINGEVSKAEEEIKSANDVISKKGEAGEEDLTEANQAGENRRQSVQDAKDDTELKISSVVSKVEAGEADQDKLSKVKEKIKERLSEIQDAIDLLDGKRGEREEVLTYLKRIAGIKDRSLTKEEEKKYWGRAMYGLKAEKQGYEAVDIFFNDTDSSVGWKNFQEYLRFSISEEKKSLNEVIGRIEKNQEASNKGKSKEQLKKEAERDSEAVKKVINSFIDKTVVKKKEDNKAQKQSEPVGEPKPSSKNPTELENDIEETNHKTNGSVYGKESTPEDAQEAAEKIKNGKKAKKAAEDIKDEEKNQEPAKEKTPEEILREKNIEVYGGADKLNQIFEDYKRLNELEDKKAYYDDSPLFSEWDALRVKIANINLEVFGKDRTVDLYKIQNKDEMIREYFNTKLEEPLEDFQKDIQKASPNELAIRAATLIKYRNELKNCDWQGKDKYRDIPKKEYLEIIKILEQKIEILNGALPKKEGVSTEAALKDLSINDFKKIEKEPEYKGRYPAVIEAGPKIELTNEQSARVEKILKDFDLKAEDAEKIEGFKDLSYGQKLLALENLKQMTLREVQQRALAENDEKTGEAGQKYAKSKGWLAKAGAGAKMIWRGITKSYKITRSKTRIHGELAKEDYGKILQDVVRGIKNEVVERNGKLEIQYLNNLENLSESEKNKTQCFNEVATELSRLPQSLDQ